MITYTFSSPSQKLSWKSKNRRYIAMPLSEIRKNLLDVAKQSDTEETKHLFNALALAEDLTVDVS
ncbi:hypothetical protein P7F88_06835 [Vibrio hannami]|uniref:hypothetical protein n=1 Tax=Vibrio hannami TaxID=2717094 RepID=UPI0024102CDF|nr:hypothetical protein [Vibrio hannami]MDG3085824.1 hypothetical protein [Vibrio hannami]